MHVLNGARMYRQTSQKYVQECHTAVSKLIFTNVIINVTRIAKTSQSSLSSRDFIHAVIGKDAFEF